MSTVVTSIVNSITSNGNTKGHLTPEQAREKNCHLVKPSGHLCSCVADACMQWRWRPLVCSQLWKEAVIKHAKATGDKSPNKHVSAAYVAKNMAEFGLEAEPYEGWCGLSGEPKA